MLNYFDLGPSTAVTFNRIDPEGKLVMGFRKAIHNTSLEASAYSMMIILWCALVCVCVCVHVVSVTSLENKKGLGNGSIIFSQVCMQHSCPASPSFVS